MKKKVFILAAIAGLAISAIAVSCNKSEAEQPVVQEKAKPTIFNVTPHEWWSIWEGAICYEQKLPFFCYYSFTSVLDPDNTWSTLIHDMAITEMVYDDFVNLPIDPDRRNSYNKFLQDGFIEIHYDCPIEHPELLKHLDTDFIPAGTYPIFLRGNDLVIRFANKN